MATEAGLGNDTAGVWTTAQALACGLSEGTIARRVTAGRWQRVQRGTYADGGVVPSPLMRGWAAVLSRGGPGSGWAAGRTTVRLLGLPLIDDDDPATGACDAASDDVAVRQARPGTSGTLHVRRHVLQRGDTVLVDGCPSLTLTRALPGLAAVLSFEALVCVLDAGLSAELLTPDVLATAVTRGGGRRCAVVLRRAVALADGRAESPSETLARLLLRPVLPGLVPQVRLYDEAARLLARFHLADKALRLAVESDGRQGHAGERMVAKDARRDAASARLGWTTERCTWFQLRREPEATRRRIGARAATLRAGSPRPGALA